MTAKVGLLVPASSCFAVINMLPNFNLVDSDLDVLVDSDTPELHVRLSRIPLVREHSREWRRAGQCVRSPMFPHHDVHDRSVVRSAVRYLRQVNDEFLREDHSARCYVRDVTAAHCTYVNAIPTVEPVDCN